MFLFIRKKDVHLKARMLSEGVNIQGDIENYFPHLTQEPVELDLPDEIDIDIDNPEEIMELFTNLYNSKELVETNAYLGVNFKFKRSGLITAILPNENSPLNFVIEGNKATVSENGTVLVKGKFLKPPKWTDAKLSNGMPIQYALPGAGPDLINILFSISCYNFNSGQGCKYCNLFANPVSRKLSTLPMGFLAELAKYQAEAVKILTDHGWKGAIAISGGALPPDRRGEYLERLELVLDALHKTVEKKKLRKCMLTYNYYAPEDFKDMLKWKEMGINASSIDLEVFDPKVFADICPGKHAYKPLEYWKEAQIYARKVFGSPASLGMIVLGLEPLESFLAGVDERFSKGILSVPLVFRPLPGSALENHPPPTADYIVKACEGFADSFYKHGPKIIAAAIKGSLMKKGAISRATSLKNTSLTPVIDEIYRRLRSYKTIWLVIRSFFAMFKSYSKDRIKIEDLERDLRSDVSSSKNLGFETIDLKQ